MAPWSASPRRSEEHTSELQSLRHLVCRLLLEKKKNMVTRRPEKAEPAIAALDVYQLSRDNHRSWLSFTTFVIIRLSKQTSNFFFFNDTATTEIYTLSLHDALPI